LHPVAENNVKPTADWISLTVETATMRTIPVTVDATRQIISDQGQLQSLIDNQLMFELGYSEAWNIVYGNGTSPELDGILNDADVQSLLWSNGQSGDTKIDTLRRAMTLVTLARYPADGIAVNPTDWEDIELAKGSDEHYLWISVTQGGQQVFFRLPVAVTEAVDSGTAIVGAWKLGATLYDREQGNIRISDQHSDYFKRNMISVLAEERLALAVNRPEAFVEVTFDSAPA
jgi:HK97 family phage major capsid protein